MTRLYTVEILLFFFNDTATTEIYTLSLHDALPISSRCTDFPNFFYFSAVYHEAMAHLWSNGPVLRGAQVPDPLAVLLRGAQPVRRRALQPVRQRQDVVGMLPAPGSART